jgi:hypothetical protein
MVDFNKLIDKASSNVDKFRDAVEKEQTKSFVKDEGFWQPTVDKAGNGSAVIRFLPTPPQDGDDGLPWVKYFSHGFQGPTGLWYIENSLTTMGKDDPVSEYNSKLWATRLDDNKKIVREQKRKLTYVSNIYVVKDPGNPENEGKVFKYKYGKKIHDKVVEAMNPAVDELANESEKVEAIDPFHFINGANFRLRIRKIDGYRNYDKSDFDKVSPLLGGDATKLKAIWDIEYSLKEMIGADKFKDYATLKQRLDRVLGIDTSGAAFSGHGESVAHVEPKPVMKSSTAENVQLTADDDDPELFANLAEPR